MSCSLQLLFYWCLLPSLLLSLRAASAPPVLGRAGPLGFPMGPPRSCLVHRPQTHNTRAHLQFPSVSLIHLISYRYTTGKIFLARSVLRQLKPNSQLLGISIHYQSWTGCSILSFFLLQVACANNLQYFQNTGKTVPLNLQLTLSSDSDCSILGCSFPPQDSRVMLFHGVFMDKGFSYRVQGHPW